MKLVLPNGSVHNADATGVMTIARNGALNTTWETRQNARGDCSTPELQNLLISTGVNSTGARYLGLHVYMT